MAVTPRVGVWIEIIIIICISFVASSHPAWVCGLKSYDAHGTVQAHAVTPRVGVWIEIYPPKYQKNANKVTPRVGVWIEILRNGNINGLL